jgi:hypothetical protein
MGAIACDGLLGIEPLDASADGAPDAGPVTHDATDARGATDGSLISRPIDTGSEPDSVADASTRPVPVLGAVRDFNGDGLVDLLWYDAATGESLAWFMAGTSVIGSSLIKEQATQQPLSMTTPWSPVGLADMNLDGHVDLLWQNSHTGEIQVWFLAGTDRIGSDTIHEESNAAPVSALSPWYLGATGDFNRDGSVDLVFHRPDTGDTQIWFMSGTHRISSASIFDEKTDASADADTSNSKLVSAADFNGDGWPDLLWWYAPSGGPFVWFMNGSTRTTWSNLYNGERNAPTGPNITVYGQWAMVGTGDVNRDHEPDIIWYNSSTGQSEIWYMTATTLTADSLVTDIFDAGDAQGLLILPPWSPVPQ